MRFFNQLWSCTDNSNAKVFLQYELELAGLDIHLLDNVSPTHVSPVGPPAWLSGGGGGTPGPC